MRKHLPVLGGGATLYKNMREPPAALHGVNVLRRCHQLMKAGSVAMRLLRRVCPLLRPTLPGLRRLGKKGVAMHMPDKRPGNRDLLR